MNHGTFSGNLGRDAKTGVAGQRNTPFLSFPLGVSIGYGDNQHTLWVGCTLWGKRAEGKLVEHLGKGAKIVVQGEVDLEIYDKADGSKGATVTCRVSTLELMEGKQNESVKPKEASPQQSLPPDEYDDDIPF